MITAPKPGRDIPSVTGAALPPHAWRVVGLLWIVGLLNYLDRVMITTMHGSITAAIPMTEAQFGLLTTAFLVVYAVLSPFAGFLADRSSRRRVIIVSLIAWSLMTWLTSRATTFNQLLASRALMGVSEACYIPAALALIADYHREKSRSLANGVHMSGIMVGSGLGGFGGWLAERYGWPYAFQLFGLIGLVYAVVLFALLRDRPATNAPVEGRGPVKPVRLTEALSSLFRHSGFIVALFYWSLLGVVSWAVVGWMPTYLQEHFHLTQGRAGLSATGYLQASALVGVLVGGFWADRWSRTRVRGPILVPLVGLCIAAPSILLVSTTNLLPVAILGLMAYGLTRAFADTNMMPILCLVSEPKYRATGYGVLNFLSTAVGATAIYVGGRLRDAGQNVNQIFHFAAASLIVCVLLLACVKPKADASATVSPE